MKIKIGIIFGGSSREREISFAGGRTVYDNLNKSLFEAIPLFMDSLGNLILLNWEYIYKGSIRDFYPPVKFLPASPNEFQVYIESIHGGQYENEEQIIASVGSKLDWKTLKTKIDFAFLCLHGSNGEDGRLQGMLEFEGIPYSGSGILSSAIGINKAVQKKLMQRAGFNIGKYEVVSRQKWITKSPEEVYLEAKNRPGFPLVIKPVNQGSSIGASILLQDDYSAFLKAMNKAFFISEIKAEEWQESTATERMLMIRNLCDIREGIGVPLMFHSKNESPKKIYHPEELLEELNQIFRTDCKEVSLKAIDGENEVIIESFIEGQEFSCIVIEDEDGIPIALPPTEIKKGGELFDYRSKYLPGLSRKITPMNASDEDINKIRKECEKLFSELFFNVYARIDGFLSKTGEVFLNDPNTTSGMMPSSFFFHQAAEIGLNPSQFLTYIIRTSISARVKDLKESASISELLSFLDESILKNKEENQVKIKVAIILGGYSTERHISVESGRNIYEKLSSSEKYLPIPIFLGSSEDKKSYSLFQIPINILLKDNADDIYDKIKHYHLHPIISEIHTECIHITSKYSNRASISSPQKIETSELGEICDAVFIALHGRPGEDGQLQKDLELYHIPYNGSGPRSSAITINKYETNEILKNNGFHIPAHLIVSRQEWEAENEAVLSKITTNIPFPVIAKPVDDGCSSAVKKIKNEIELNAYLKTAFRQEAEFDKEYAIVLRLKPKEEFPPLRHILIEELVSAKNAIHFLEITAGLLTHLNEKKEIEYEMFEASETLSEGDVLSLEEKFLAGQGQNITPARYDSNTEMRQRISEAIKQELKRAAIALNIEGYARIDAFVSIDENKFPKLTFIEVNSLPGMTPATCIFHQCAINGYKPYEFINAILEYAMQKQKLKLTYEA